MLTRVLLTTLQVLRIVGDISFPSLGTWFVCAPEEFLASPSRHNRRLFLDENRLQNDYYLRVSLVVCSHCTLFQFPGIGVRAFLPCREGISIVESMLLAFLLVQNVLTGCLHSWHDDALAEALNFSTQKPQKLCLQGITISASSNGFLLQINRQRLFYDCIDFK